MRTRTQAGIWTGVCVASLSLHVAAFGGLGGHPTMGREPRPKPPTLVEMEVAKPKETPPPPETKPAPKVPKLAMARPVRASAPKPSAAPPPAAPVEETPADFTGTTLTNDGPGPGWASATGNGDRMAGPVGKAGARVTGRHTDGAAPADEGPKVVGVGDLSRPPSPPDLAPVLERFYPQSARQKGLAGKAVVRARIMPDGGARELALVSESAPGFGEACRQALRSARWTPPVDRGGQAVSTYVSYTCRFEVR
jgi:protein TonB